MFIEIHIDGLKDAQVVAIEKAEGSFPGTFPGLRLLHLVQNEVGNHWHTADGNVHDGLAP